MLHGYYTVNNTVFNNKIMALREGTVTKKQVFWHWHDEYKNVKWTQESPYSIKEVYKKRAQQLREKYDWITLAFSGGSDSYTALKSFIDNNIHLDEIFIQWPIKGSKKYYKPDATNKDTRNVYSEWDLTAKPILKEIEKTHPKIKITVYDWSDNVFKQEINDDYLCNVQDNINPGIWCKREQFVSKHEEDTFEKGKRSCILFAIDKPRVCIKDNKLYCYFLDITANNHPWYKPGRTVELFYWSKDCTEIVHTQCRTVYHYLSSNPQMQDFIIWGGKPTVDQKMIWDAWIRGIVYPDYKNWFQAKKEYDTIYCQTDYWLFRAAKGSRYLQSWQSMVDNFLSSIDKKFIQFDGDRPLGFHGFTSDFFYIGDLPIKG